MLGRAEALPPEEALRKLLDALSPIPPPEPEELDIEACCGRVLAQEVRANEDVPSFSRSTVDGYAVDSRDTFGARETTPGYLRLEGEVRMAETPGFRLRRGEAAKIPTGGMLPEGADSVVMFEHANTVEPSTLEVLRPVAPGENVIGKGEDARAGEVILSPGDVLRPQDAAAAAGVGAARLAVYKKPVVPIISTGDEVVAPGVMPLPPGSVRDMNSYNLKALVDGAGGIGLRKGIFKDEYNLLRDALLGAMPGSEMILISGGSSVGVKDHAAKIISELGEIVFHGVALKPGKPTIGGFLLLNGAGRKKPVFGVPGHPAAVAVCFEVFIRPVLALLAGARQKKLREKFSRSATARLSKSVSSSIGRTQFVRVSLFEKEGELWAEPVPGPSGLINTFVKSDGAIVVPPERQGINKGEAVRVLLF